MAAHVAAVKAEASCSVTVAQLEGCLSKAIDAKCDEAALDQAKASPDCVASSDCL